MKRYFALVFGLCCYLASAGAVLWFVAFLANVAIPWSADSAARVSWPLALCIDTFLLLQFALQHSVMARRGFKRWWTGFVPKAIERSTYVLFSGVALFVLCWFWQPIDYVIWRVESPAMAWIIQIVAAMGGLFSVASTFLIDHFDLMGLRQVFVHWRGGETAKTALTTPGPYKFVRHPIMVGLLIAFWAVPLMTAGHFLLTAAMTVYIVVAIQLEERDLVEEFGDEYRRYQKSVGQLLPRLTVGART